MHRLSDVEGPNDRQDCPSGSRRGSKGLQVGRRPGGLRHGSPGLPVPRNGRGLCRRWWALKYSTIRPTSTSKCCENTTTCCSNTFSLTTVVLTRSACLSVSTFSSSPVNGPRFFLSVLGRRLFGSSATGGELCPFFTIHFVVALGDHWLTRSIRTYAVVVVAVTRVPLLLWWCWGSDQRSNRFEIDVYSGLHLLGHTERGSGISFSFEGVGEGRRKW